MVRSIALAFLVASSAACGDDGDAPSDSGTATPTDMPLMDAGDAESGRDAQAPLDMAPSDMAPRDMAPRADAAPGDGGPEHRPLGPRVVTPSPLAAGTLRGPHGNRRRVLRSQSLLAGDA